MSGEIDDRLCLAQQLHQAQRYGEAEKLYREILAKDPHRADALHLFGVLAYQAGQLEDAFNLVLRAVQLNPSAPQYHSHLGLILLSMGRMDDGFRAMHHAISLAPGSAAAHANLAILLCSQGRFADGKAAFLRAIELDPNLPEPRLNLGTLQLLTGDFANGWENYEYRTKCAAGVAARTFSQPRWDGTPLGGRRILIHAEQGFGDVIQFVRYLPMVKQRGGRVILECRRELHRLLRGFAGIDQIASAPNLPEFEIECPLLGLARVFGTRIDSIPSQRSYLSADEETAERWMRKLAGVAKGRRIGLVWSGSPTNIGDRKRSIPLDRFSPLGEIEDAVFFSLQKGPAAAQVAAGGLKLVDFTSELGDFADTAGLISQLDLVISVDTAVAHLAGAMGKETWVLLPAYPDWRWLLEREDSPWYPTVRLFRQKRAGDWGEVIGRMADALRQK